MSNQEAIKRIENLIRGRKDKRGKTELDFALDMAIEALKEMSVEEYRQRLMEVFHNTDHDELLTYVVMPKEEEFKSLENILRQYKFEPRPHGEWKPSWNNLNESYCSHCNFTVRNELRSYFCPKCGSDNRKEGDK